MQTINLNKVNRLFSSKNEIKTAAAAFMTLLAISAVFTILPATAYYAPPTHKPTGTFVGASPTLVSLGQKVLINIITNPAPRTPSGWVGNLVGVYPSSWEN